MSITREEENNLIENLLEDSKININYLVLIISSSLIATFGLVMDNAVIIIGAMIIAPLMLPLRALSFGILKVDLQLICRSLLSLILGIFIAFIFSYIVGIAVDFPSFGNEVNSRIKPNLIDFFVAILAGFISGYSKVNSKLNDAIPGTAIAVALMPPICVIGLAASLNDGDLVKGAQLLFITNLLGITFACWTVYLAWLNLDLKGKTLFQLICFSFITGLILTSLSSNFKGYAQDIEYGYYRAKVEKTLHKARFRELIPKVVIISSKLSFNLGESGFQLQEYNILPFFRSTNPFEISGGTVRLIVQTEESIKPEQVTELEKFLKNEFKQTWKVKFYVIEQALIEAPTEAPEIKE